MHFPRIAIPLVLSAIALSCDDPTSPRANAPIEAPAVAFSRIEGTIAITDLGTLEGHSAQAHDIGDGGHVVGEASVAASYTDPKGGTVSEIAPHPFVWTEGTGMRDLLTGNQDPIWGRAFGVNAGGEVVGVMWPRRDADPTAGHAFYWSDATGFVKIRPPDLAWSNWTYAEDIADDGTVIGQVFPGSGGYRVFKWTKQGGMTLLPGYPGARDNFGIAINGTGDIVGWVYMMDGTSRPVVWWSDGRITDLRRSDGSVVGTEPNSFARAHGINDRGQVVGMFSVGTSQHPFVWDPTGAFVDLGTAAGLTSGQANDIDEHGNIVGTLYGGGPQQGFLWTPEKGMHVLPPLAGTHSAAAGINESGAIVGFAVSPSGIGHAVRWTVPFAHDPLPGTGEGIAQLSVRASHSCILRTDGQLSCWGSNGQGQSMVPAGTYTQVSAGYVHTCALNPASEAVCWGAPSGYAPMATPPAGAFVQLASGGNLSCGLRPTGLAVCWGSNSYGMLSPPAVPFTSMSAGGNHACGLTATGMALCWGLNSHGQISPPAGQYTQISAGNFHTCGLTTTGDIRCWGDNYEGGAVSVTGPFVAVSAGTSFTCGLDRAGVIKCWGRSFEGQTKAPDGKFVKLSTGWSHGCAVDIAGTLACWGSNDYGQAPPSGTNRPPFTILTPVTGGAEGQLITFDASRSSDPNGDSFKIEWFIDGKHTATGPTAALKFPNEGAYTVVAMATDGGALSQSSVRVAITNVPPAPSVTSAPASVLLGELVTLDFAVGDPGTQDAPWQYEVQWGGAARDGAPATVTATTTSPAVSLGYTYASAGTYTVTITVTDNVGASGTTTHVVDVTGTPGTTPPGTGVSVTPVDPTTGTSPVALQFGSVTSGGETSVVTSPQGPPPAQGFRLGNPPVYYEINTTASFSGPITLCITYDETTFRNERNLRLLHGDASGGWTDVTISHDMNANVICGQTASLSPFAVAEQNQAPVAAIGGPYQADESQPVMLDASGSIDPDGEVVSYRFNFGDGSPELVTTDPRPAHVYADDGSYPVLVAVLDSDGAPSLPVATTVEVRNVAPSLGGLSGPLNPQTLGSTVTVSAPFGDPGTIDAHLATVDWGDGSTTTHAASDGAASGSHAYAEPGVYTVRMTVADDDGGVSGAALFQYVVVYDPSAGFVTGGGWITSPAGAYAREPLLSGKATFGFVARYQRGATVPTGDTEFQFIAGSLRFKSTSYQWLVVAGSRATFKGEGTIAGESTRYGFLLTAIDGDAVGGTKADRFRIKIWRLDDEAIVYDNQLGATDDSEQATQLGGGSIVIHSK